MKILKKRSMLFGILSITAVLFLFSALTAGPKMISEKDFGFLGVNVEKMSSDDRDEFGVKFGVLVVNVLEGESAQKAGLKKYDVIQFFKGVKIHRPEDLTTEVRKVKPGTKVKLLIVRDGKEKSVMATLGKLKKREYKFQDFRKNILKVFGESAYLGVQIQPLNNDLASYFGTKQDGGALVIRVDKGTPAEKAGIKSGDVIVSVEKEKIKNGDDLVKVIKKFEPGKKIKITLLRHRKQMSVMAVLEKGKYGKFMNIIRFPEKGVSHVYVPDIPEFDKDEILIWKDKAGKEIKERMHELKERLKEGQERMKEELIRVKEHSLRLKEENKKRIKELKKVKELRRVREYIYI